MTLTHHRTLFGHWTREEGIFAMVSVPTPADYRRADRAHWDAGGSPLDKLSGSFLGPYPKDTMQMGKE